MEPNDQAPLCLSLDMKDIVCKREISCKMYSCRCIAKLLHHHLPRLSYEYSSSLQYLEETYPQNPLLPSNPQLRAINLQADVFLAPQIAIAAEGFNVDMSKFPTLDAIYESCKTMQEFQASLPDRQPDALP